MNLSTKILKRWMEGAIGQTIICTRRYPNQLPLYKPPYWSNAAFCLQYVDPEYEEHRGKHRLANSTERATVRKLKAYNPNRVTLVQPQGPMFDIDLNTGWWHFIETHLWAWHGVLFWNWGWRVPGLGYRTRYVLATRHTWGWRGLPINNRKDVRPLPGWKVHDDGRFVGSILNDSLPTEIGQDCAQLAFVAAEHWRKLAPYIFSSDSEHPLFGSNGMGEIGSRMTKARWEPSYTSMQPLAALRTNLQQGSLTAQDLAYLQWGAQPYWSYRNGIPTDVSAWRRMMTRLRRCVTRDLMLLHSFEQRLTITENNHA